MPRVTNSKGRLNSTKFSQFYPGIASSPLKEQSLSKNELEQHLQEHKSEVEKVVDECKVNLVKQYNEAFDELDKTIEDLLSTGDFDFPVTPEVLKVARAMFKKCLKGVNETGNKTAYKKAGEGDNNQDDSDSDEQHTVKNGTAKKLPKQQTFIIPESGKIVKEQQSKSKNTCSEEDVFKKPAGVTRKTRQASSNICKEYQTPKRLGYNRGYNIAKVTPGPDIDRPLSVLRRPGPGEMAVSMNGSPLVTTHDNISVPQMTIPLSNGRVLTYLANEGLDPEESLCVDIDEETQERLNVFYKLLEKKIKKK